MEKIYFKDVSRRLLLFALLLFLGGVAQAQTPPASINITTPVYEFYENDKLATADALNKDIQEKIKSAINSINPTLAEKVVIKSNIYDGTDIVAGELKSGVYSYNIQIIGESIEKSYTFGITPAAGIPDASVNVDAPTLNSKAAAHAIVSGAILVNQEVGVLVPDVNMTTANATEIAIVNAAVKSRLNRANAGKGLDFDGIGLNWQNPSFPLSAGQYLYKFRVTNHSGVKKKVLISAGANETTFELANGANKELVTTSAYVKVNKAKKSYTIEAPVKFAISGVYGSLIDESKLRSEITLDGLAETAANVGIQLKSDKGELYALSSTTTPAGTYTVVLSPTIPDDPDFIWNPQLTNCTNVEGKILLDAKLTVKTQMISSITVPAYTSGTDLGAFPANATLTGVCRTIKRNITGVAGDVVTSVSLIDEDGNSVFALMPGQTYDYRISLNPNYIATNQKTNVSSNNGVVPNINRGYIDVPLAVEIENIVSVNLPSIKYNTVKNEADLMTEDALKASVLTKLKTANKVSVNKGLLSFKEIEITGAQGYPLEEGTTYGYTFKIEAGAKAIVIDFPGTTYPDISLKGNTETKEPIAKPNSIAVAKGSSTVNIILPELGWGNFVYGTGVGDLKKLVKIEGISGVSPEFELVSKVTGAVYPITYKRIPAGNYKVRLIVSIPKSTQALYVPEYKNCTEIGTISTEAEDTYTLESSQNLTISRQPVSKCTLPIFTGEPGMLDKMSVNLSTIDIISRISANTALTPNARNGSPILFTDNGFTAEVIGSPEPGKTYSYRILLNPNYSAIGLPLNYPDAQYNEQTHSIDVKDAVKIEDYTNIAVVRITYSIPQNTDVLSSRTKFKEDIWTKLTAANTGITEVVELLKNNTYVVKLNNTPISGTSQVYPGIYDYEFTVRAKVPLKAKVIGTTSASPDDFELAAGETQLIKVTGQITVEKATIKGRLECPTSWKKYTYGTVISDLKDQITCTIKNFTPDYFLVPVDGGREIPYDGTQMPPAGKYRVKIAYNDGMVTDWLNYNITAINCKLIDGNTSGIYISDAILTVNQQALPEAIVFPVFTDGSFGKMAANTTVSNAIKILMTKTIGGKTDKMIADFKIYDKDFNKELPRNFKLVPGETYSYEVLLSPNYTQGKKISASVGAQNIIFTNGVYRIQRAIEVAKASMTIKLPSYLDIHALKTDAYANTTELIAMLTSQIHIINPDLAKKGLTVGVKTKATMQNGSMADYTITISGDNASKYNFIYATNGNVSSTQLVPSPNGESCVFKNALYFLDQLLTDKSLTLPTLFVDYECPGHPNEVMKASTIIEELTSALVLANPDVLNDPSKYTVELINHTGDIPENVGTISYKLTIKTEKDILEDITVTNWMPGAMARVDDVSNARIELTYNNAITVQPRPTIDLTFPDYKIQYVEGLTKAEVADMLRDSLTLKNPAYSDFASIEVGEFSETTGTVSYKVVLDYTLGIRFAGVNANGVALQLNADQFYVYENGKVTIIPRPEVSVNLYKYEFKKDGATEELMAKAIYEDLLAKNANLKGAYIKDVQVIFVSENLYTYKVFFNPTNMVRAIHVEGDGFTPKKKGAVNTGLTVTAAKTITLNQNSGLVLADYPFEAKVTLPVYSHVFGLTAEQHGAVILQQLQNGLTVGTNIPKPDLNNWGVKVQLIENMTGANVAIPLDGQSYPEVSDLYGYQIITDANTQFAQYYKMNYQPASGMSVVADELNPNNVIVKLSAKVTMATDQLKTPGVYVTYGDNMTKAFTLESIKEAILKDSENEELFKLIACTGILPENSFTVAFAQNTYVPEEGAIPAGNYPYEVTFNEVVTRNIVISQSGEMKLVVNKATETFVFNDSYSFVYGKTKETIAGQIKAAFLADNEALLSRYACFANSGDLFTVELTPYEGGSVADKPTVHDDYGYKVTADASLFSNFNFKAEETDQFTNYVREVVKSVDITEKTVKIILPTYLGAIEGTPSAKAAFIYGKSTKEEIQETIKTDIEALNAKKLKGDYQLYVSLIAEDEYPAYSTDAYAYRILLTSNDFKYKFEIGQPASVAADPNEPIKQIASGAVLINPANISTIVFDKEQQTIIGQWSINNGVPVFESSLEIGDNAYGFDLVSFIETPENPVSMTADRWNDLFESGKLVWALKQNGEVKYYAPRLADLIDKVKAEVTAGTFALTIIETPTDLKSVVGNFDIPLGQSLATLKVIPAVVKVNPADASYAKVYGITVTQAGDFNAPLDFSTEPALNGVNLADGFDLIDLFVTKEPLGADVYKANAPVGNDYKIGVTADPEVFGGAFTPMLGVHFQAGDGLAIVEILPAPMAELVTVNFAASREYGEAPVDDDIVVTVKGNEETNVALMKEINDILNAAEGRVNWIDWASFNKKTNAGKYEIRFAGNAISSMNALLTNFDMEGVTVTLDSLEIRKADLTVTAADKSRVYGVANPELTIDYDGLKNNEYQSLDDVFDGDILPAVATDATTSSRGDWEIYFTQKPTAKNYNVEYVTGILSIDKVKRVIVWPEDQRNLTIAVGETVELSAAVTSADDNKLSITGVRYELSNNDRERVVLYQNENGKMMIEGKMRTLDGPVHITVYADGDKTTYEDADPVTGTITVVAPEGDAANVNIIVSNVTSVYDGTPRAVTVKAADKDGKEIDYKVFYEGDQTASTVYPSDQNAPVDAGTYKVTVKAEVGSTTFVYEAKNKMIIAPRVVEVKARSFETVYGKTIPDYTNAYDYDKNDFLAGEDFDADKTPVVRAEGYKGNAGTYKLTPYSAQDFGKNYKVTYISGELVIAKAPLTITADDKESVYSNDPEELTYTIEGLVNGETIKNLGFAPRISSTVTKNSDAGTYLIVFADNYESANYEVTYKEGKYVVVPAEQKIIWNPKTEIALGEDIYLNALASSNLPVSYSVSNEDVAYLNQIGDKWILTPVTDGYVEIQAMQNGDNNYWPATPKKLLFAIGDAGATVDNEEIAVATSITVYPTVFTHSVTVAAPSAIKRVELVSYAGVLLKVFNQPESVIDLSNFGKGFYLLNVTLEDGTSKGVKLIKK